MHLISQTKHSVIFHPAVFSSCKLITSYIVIAGFYFSIILIWLRVQKIIYTKKSHFSLGKIYLGDQ